MSSMPAVHRDDVSDVMKENSNTAEGSKTRKFERKNWSKKKKKNWEFIRSLHRHLN